MDRRFVISVMAIAHSVHHTMAIDMVDGISAMIMHIDVNLEVIKVVGYDVGMTYLLIYNIL